MSLPIHLYDPPLPAFRTTVATPKPTLPIDMPPPPPHIKELGQLLAQIEDPTQLEKALRHIHQATAQGKITAEEALQLLQVGYDNYLLFHGSTAQNVMNVGYLWALVESQPGYTQALEALAHEQIKRALAFDFNRSQLVRTSHQLPHGLNAEQKRIFLKAVGERLPKRPSRKEIRANRTKLENIWVQKLEDIKNCIRPLEAAHQLGQCRLRLSLLLGSSHCQAALQIIKDMPAPVQQKRDLSIAYQQGALQAAGEHSPAWAILTLNAGNQEMQHDPDTALRVAPAMITALCRLATLCPQTLEKQEKILFNIQELIRRVMNRKHNPQPEEIMALFSLALNEITNKRRDSLLHLIVELSATRRQLRFYPADEEAAQKLGYLQVNLAYRQHHSLRRMLKAVREFISTSGKWAPPDSQKEHFLLGAIGATPESSPERILLLNELDLFEQRNNVEHQRDQELDRRASRLLGSRQVMAQHRPFFTKAFCDFLNKRAPARRVIHRGTLPPSSIEPPLPDID